MAASALHAPLWRRGAAPALLRERAPRFVHSAGERSAAIASNCSTWQIYDNGDLPGPRLIAPGYGDTTQVSHADLWGRIVRQWTGAHG